MNKNRITSAIMNLLLKLFFLLIFLQRISASVSSVTYDGAKAIQAKCPCPKSVASFFGLILNPFAEVPCKCPDNIINNETCKCSHGKYIQKKKKCICNKCWTGNLCDKLKKEHLPTFSRNILNIKTTLKELKMSHLPMVERFVENSCSSKYCPCGRTVYDIKDKGNGFTLAALTEFIRNELLRLNSPRHQFYIRVRNELNKRNRPFMKMTVNIVNEKDKKKSRQRRNTQIPLVVTAVPYIDGGKYYFNAGDKIKYRIRVTHDGSISNAYAELQDITVRVTSEKLKISSAQELGFDLVIISSTISRTWADFKRATLSRDDTCFGDVFGVVKSDVTPLDELTIQCSSKVTTSDIGTIISEPKIYVLPVNTSVARDNIGGLMLYSSTGLSIQASLPQGTYEAKIEILTGTQAPHVLSITNPSLTINPSIVTSGNLTPTLNSIHHVVFDLGSAQVTSSDVVLNVGFNVTVSEDDPELYNNSQHSIALSVKTGSSAMWLGTEIFTIFKSEPELEVKTVLSMDDFSRLTSNDAVDLDYRVLHNLNSTKEANNLTLFFENPGYKVTSSSSGNLILHDTMKFEVPLGDFKNSLGLLEEATGNLSLTVREKDYWPLEPITGKLIVHYQNSVGITKVPYALDLPTMLHVEPNITAYAIESPPAYPNSVQVFGLKISLDTVAKADINLQIIMPVDNGSAVLTIKSATVKHFGSNLLPQTSANDAQQSFTISNNHANLNFSVITKSVAGTLGGNENEIEVEINACVSGHDGIVNGTVMNVGFGIKSLPYMLWVSKVPIAIFTSASSNPKLQFEFKIFNKSKDIFELYMKVGVDPLESTGMALNVTFQFYMTPYIDYKELINKSSDLTQAENTVFKIDALSCTDEVEATIRVELDRGRYPFEGEKEIYLLSRLAYFSKSGERFQYAKAVKRTIKAIPKFLKIPKDPNGVKDYYGRGIYGRIHPPSKNLEVFVCVNQHANSHKPACFVSEDYGARWRALDSRYGSIVGYNDTGELVGVSRNQRHYLYYDKSSNYYIAYMPKTLSAGGYINLEDAFYYDLNDPDTEIRSDHILTFGDHSFAGAGDGLYYRFQTNPWVRRAKWPK